MGSKSEKGGPSCSDDRLERGLKEQIVSTMTIIVCEMLDWMKPIRHPVCLRIHGAGFGEAAGGLQKNRRVPGVHELSSYFL